MFVPDTERLIAFARSKLADLRELLDKPVNVPEVRAMLERKVGTIQMQPIEEEGEAFYLAKGSLNFLSGEEQARLVGAAGRS
jgi:hypothetical protein